MKLIISGDIHIHDYAHHNLGPDFRLNQFIKLAHRLVQIGQEKGADDIALAGDILHKPIITPKVASVVSEFFGILSTHYENIYYVLGQHDIDLKSNTQTERDSIVPFISKFVNASYMDGKIIDIGGRQVAFSNWRPTQDWSFIEDKVDVMIGHLTMHSMYGQEYDDSKYSIGFFGDIHQRNSSGNSHTTNVPIPHYISDNQDGSVICLNMDDLSWERVATETPEFKFLKIYYSDQVPEGADPEYTVEVTKPEIIKDVESLYKSIELDTVIDHVVKNSEIEDVESLHSEVSSVIPNDAGQVDLNFILQSIKIKNFRSIESLEYNFTTGVTAIIGHNGSGKSTMMNAIDFALRGSSSARRLVKTHESEMSVELDVFYQGRTHTIERGVRGGGYLKYMIDGDDVGSNNQRDLNAVLNENLPFIGYFNLLYRKQGQAYLLSDFNYAGRIDLITKLLGLDKIQYYFNHVNNMIKPIKQGITSLESDKSRVEGAIEALEDRDYSAVIKDESAHRESIDSKKQEIELVKSKISKIDSYASLASTIDQLGGTLAGISYDEELANMDIESIQANIKQGESIYSTFQDEKQEAVREKSLVESAVANIKKSISSTTAQMNNTKIEVCPSCKRPMDNQDIESVKEHLAGEIAKMEADLQAAELELARVSDLAKEVAVANDQKMAEIRGTINHMLEQVSKILAEREKVDKFKLVQSKLDEAESQRKSMDVPKEDRVELVDAQQSLQAQVEKLERELWVSDSLKKDLERLNSTKTELATIEEMIENNTKEISRLTSYANLFSKTGSVVRSVFSEIAGVMTSDDVIVRTVKELASGELRIDFDIDFRVGQDLIPYSELSGGQKVYTDIYFVGKLFEMAGSVGCFIMDETLRDLDVVNLDLVMDNISKAPVHTILMSTHVESFTSYNQKIIVNLDGNTSQYSIGDGVGIKLN